MALHPDIEKELRRAIKHFWSTRQKQAKKQGSKSGARDAGARTAVTGGHQMDGFINLVRDYLCANGLPKAQVFCGKAVEIPGWYRPEKQWDLLVISDGELVAGIEFKSQVGSFGNNYNNRTEEAIGSATDIWAAFREGAFKPSARPWLDFKVFPEFRDASYGKRYEILLTKLVRERLYDSACFLLSNVRGGVKGDYREPAAELTFEKFITSLLARASTIARTRKPS